MHVSFILRSDGCAQQVLFERYGVFCKARFIGQFYAGNSIAAAEKTVLIFTKTDDRKTTHTSEEYAYIISGEAP